MAALDMTLRLLCSVVLLLSGCAPVKWCYSSNPCVDVRAYREINEDPTREGGLVGYPRLKATF